MTSRFGGERKGPSDLEAYDLFALGMADFNKGGEDGFAKSIKLFDAAIAKDPNSVSLM